MKKYWKSIALSMGILTVTVVSLPLLFPTASYIGMNHKDMGLEIDTYEFNQRYRTASDFWGLIGYDLQNESYSDTSRSIQLKITEKMVLESGIKALSEKYDIEVTRKEMKEKLDKDSFEVSDTYVRTRSVEARLLQEKLFNHYMNEQTVTDEDIETFYKENPALFSSDDEISLKRILFQSKEEAETSLKMIKDGVSFEKMAKEKSKDSASSDTGGDIGTLSKKDLEPDVSKVLFSLKKDEVSPVIETVFGFQIFKIVNIKEGKNASLEEAKTFIEERIRTTKAQEQLSKELDEHFQKASTTK